MPRYLLIFLMLSACNGSGLLRGSGEVAPTPAGHAKLCQEMPDMPGCPK